MTRQSITALTVYDAARQALEAAHSIDEVREIRDKAEALRVYARQAQDVDMQNWAAEIRVRAERRAGQLLVEMKATGQRHSGKGNNRKLKSPETTPKLANLRVSKTESSKWQRLAAPDNARFERSLRNIMGNGKELTTAAMLRDIAPPKQGAERDCLEELQKRLSPLLPLGNDGQLILAELLEEATGLENPDLEALRTIVVMLKQISAHFAMYAEKLEAKIGMEAVA